MQMMGTDGFLHAAVVVATTNNEEAGLVATSDGSSSDRPFHK